MVSERSCRNPGSEASPQGTLFNTTTVYLLITLWEGRPDLTSVLSLADWPAGPSLIPFLHCLRPPSSALLPSDIIRVMVTGVSIYRELRQSK